SAVAAESPYHAPPAGRDRMHAGLTQPDRDDADHRPNDQPTVGSTRQAPTAAEPRASSPQQLVERGDIRADAEAGSPTARRLAPWPAAFAVVGRRFAAAVAAALAPRPLGVGEQAANPAAPPQK